MLPEIAANLRPFTGTNEGVRVLFRPKKSNPIELRALMDFGIMCVISTSFADIFNNNCFNNGLLPVVLAPEEIAVLMDEAKGGNHMVSIDLEAQTVISPSGKTFGFQIDPVRKDKMLRGLDAIGETMMHGGDIDLFESKRAIGQPWLEL
jgi:3-isopropylmalate dehydratase small subunit